MTSVIPVRVMVEDVWDDVWLELPTETPVGEIKRQALALTRVKHAPSEYVLKYRGAELSDEWRTASAAGLVPNSSLIVLARRRRPLR